MVRILLADESAVVRRGLRALLETREGFKICGEAIDGRAAVQLAAHLRPDVVVLEISLPILNGIEATRQIRKIAPTTEVLVFTLEYTGDKIQAALQAGACGFVLKSETDEEILKAVAAVSVHGRTPPDHLTPSRVKRNGNEASDQSLALTARELEVVRLIADGKSNKLIAHLLDISTKTVETHRSTSMRKLNVHSAAQLVRHAIRCGLIQP
jgi:DNA-binding NarL/FixJ family response regulator